MTVDSAAVAVDSAVGDMTVESADSVNAESKFGHHHEGVPISNICHSDAGGYSK